MYCALKAVPNDEEPQHPTQLPAAAVCLMQQQRHADMQQELGHWKANCGFLMGGNTPDLEEALALWNYCVCGDGGHFGGAQTAHHHHVAVESAAVGQRI